MKNDIFTKITDMGIYKRKLISFDTDEKMKFSFENETEYFEITIYKDNPKKVKENNNEKSNNI